MASPARVIGTAGIISVGVGTANSYLKNNRPPSFRFLIGSGVAYLLLSALGEAEPEVAKALAIAVATTVLLGDGGGVLTYIAQHGETDTQRKSPSPRAPARPSVKVVKTNVGTFRLDDVLAYPGLTATPPVPSTSHLSPAWAGGNP